MYKINNIILNTIEYVGLKLKLIVCKIKYKTNTIAEKNKLKMLFLSLNDFPIYINSNVKAPYSKYFENILLNNSSNMNNTIIFISFLKKFNLKNNKSLIKNENKIFNGKNSNE